MFRPTYCNRRGFTLVEIMIVVAIIALLAAIAVPGFLRAQTLTGQPYFERSAYDRLSD